MANPNSPFGFLYDGRRDGSPPNFGNRVGLIASANTNKIFTGDVLKPVAGGYLDVFTAPVGGGAPIGGIAGWFQWNSISQNKSVWQNWWPGNGDANGDVQASYYADPFATFLVQCLLGPVANTSVGLNANFNVGGGGQTFGAGNKSSFSLDDGTLGTGPSLPFKIYSLPNYSPLNPIFVQPGFDPTSAYNQVLVTMNNLVA